MEKNQENRASRRQRFWTILPWALVAFLILLPLATLYVMIATQDDDIVAVTRNDVVPGAEGKRSWHGAFTNRTSDVFYRDIVAVILFIDKDGVPVGQVSRRADRLAPGENLDLDAPLPPEAVRMQMYALRWSDNSHTAVFGPFKQWEFGYRQ